MSSPERRPGRPRSQAAHDAVVEATLALLRESGLRELTIEAIARRSGVGKPTIYRWWPSKNAVAVEAVFGMIADDVSYPSHLSATDALITQVQVVAQLLAGELGQGLAEMMGEAQADEQTLHAINQRFHEIRRAAARDLIKRGQHAGEFRADIDADEAIDLIYGPLYYRWIFRHLPLTPDFAEANLQNALRGLAPR